MWVDITIRCIISTIVQDMRSFYLIVHSSCHINAFNNYSITIICGIVCNYPISLRMIQNSIGFLSCQWVFSSRNFLSIRIIQWIRRSRRRTIIITNSLLQL